MWPSIGKDAVEPSFRPKAGGCTSLDLQNEEEQQSHRSVPLCMYLTHNVRMHARVCTHTSLLPFSVQCLQIGCFLDIPSLAREGSTRCHARHNPTGTVLVVHDPGRTFPHPRRLTSPVSRTQALDAGPCCFHTVAMSRDSEPPPPALVELPLLTSTMWSI